MIRLIVIMSSLSFRKTYILSSHIEKIRLKSHNVESFQPADRTSIPTSSRNFDVFDVYLQFKDADDVALLKNIYEKHGQTVKNLEWCNWSKHALNEKDVVEMLNSIPNMEQLRMGAWSTKFLLQESSKNLLNLQKLKKLIISECEVFIVDFFLQNLPENVLEELKINKTTIPQETLKSFLEKQKRITKLDIQGQNISDTEHFKRLKLERLKFEMLGYKDLSAQQSFLRALIQMQPRLKSLILSHYVNDDIFHEITNLQLLENLKINIDEVSPNVIHFISKLKNLKTFVIETGFGTSPEIIENLSLQKLPIEHLIIDSYINISDQSYQHFSQNFKLKSLVIGLGFYEPINFFMENFPNLEVLSVRFGDANNKVELSDVLDGDDLQVHDKMKNLKLEFFGKALVDCGEFLKLLSCFPNLQKFDSRSNFPFSAEFFSSLAANLNQIRSLHLTGLDVNDDEEFSAELIASLKKISQKLDYCKIEISNVQSLFGNRKRSSDEEVKSRKVFSFEPLKDALKYDFKINETCMCNIRIHRNLTLTSGKFSGFLSSSHSTGNPFEILKQ